MSPALTRRGLVQAGTIALGAPLAGMPVAARAAVPDLDAPLFEALARHEEARAAWIATHGPHDDAMHKAAAAYPPRPKTLNGCWTDTLAGLEPSGREWRPDGTLGGFYVESDIDRLRAASPVTRPEWKEEGKLPSPVPYPEGEARRQEVIKAFDAWEAARQEVRDAVGLTAAAQASDVAGEVLNDVEDLIERLPARTVAGLVAKARWALVVAEATGSDEPIIRVVWQLAAFDEAAS